MNKYRSIRWQLMAWQRFLLAAVLITLLSLHYHLRRKSEIAEVDASLQSALMSVMPAVAPMMGRGGPPPYEPNSNAPPPRYEPDEENNPLIIAETYLEEIESNGYYVTSWDTEKGLMLSVGAVPASASLGNYELIVETPHFLTLNGNRELVVTHNTDLIIVIGRPLTDVNLALKKTRYQLLLVGSLVFLIGHIGGGIIIRRTLQPIREISQTAEEIARGDHSRRIELAAAPEELASLAQTLNNSFNHLDSALEAQIRFSADASHELRTPIAVIMAQTQAALKRDRSTEEYKTILQACLRAGIRMRTMADSLLELTRISGNGSVLNMALTNLSEVISSAVEEATQLSENHPLSFQTLENSRPVQIDPERIHQVLMNLISNAVKHNPDGCTIRISQKETAEWAILEIADEGTGIPVDALPHIFERFYRVDESRSRESGGSGLGLSIVKSIIETHGGTIEAASIPGQGTTFTIQLPLNPASDR
ncbi:HAMP domain-containing sensor histidine kinase [Pontiellaceae bacterium B1224]|nr:HAMP domain-containing sensor histidine kinase [Pontiellaceae bacterium B1224]